VVRGKSLSADTVSGRVQNESRLVDAISRGGCVVDKRFRIRIVGPFSGPIDNCSYDLSLPHRPWKDQTSATRRRRNLTRRLTSRDNGSRRYGFIVPFISEAKRHRRVITGSETSRRCFRSALPLSPLLPSGGVVIAFSP